MIIVVVKVRKFPDPNSIVDFCKSHGLSSSKLARYLYAKVLDVEDYDFSEEKNIELLNKMTNLFKTN